VDIKKHLFRFARIGSKPEIVTVSIEYRLHFESGQEIFVLTAFSFRAREVRYLAKIWPSKFFHSPPSIFFEIENYILVVTFLTRNGQMPGSDTLNPEIATMIEGTDQWRNYAKRALKDCNRWRIAVNALILFFSCSVLVLIAIIIKYPINEADKDEVSTRNILVSIGFFIPVLLGLLIGIAREVKQHRYSVLMSFENRKKILGTLINDRRDPDASLPIVLYLRDFAGDVDEQVRISVRLWYRNAGTLFKFWLKECEDDFQIIEFTNVQEDNPLVEHFTHSVCVAGAVGLARGRLNCPKTCACNRGSFKIAVRRGSLGASECSGSRMPIDDHRRQQI